MEHTFSSRRFDLFSSSMCVYVSTHTTTEEGPIKEVETSWREHVLHAHFNCYNRSTENTEKYIAADEAVRSNIKLCFMGTLSLCLFLCTPDMNSAKIKSNYIP